MRYVLIASALLGALYGLHRVGLWEERRGWIYYRKKRSSGALGNALLEVHAMVEPSQRYVLDEIRKDDAEVDEPADPPAPGHLPPAGARELDDNG